MINILIKLGSVYFNFIIKLIRFLSNNLLIFIKYLSMTSLNTVNYLRISIFNLIGSLDDISQDYYPQSAFLHIYNNPSFIKLAILYL